MKANDIVKEMCWCEIFSGFQTLVHLSMAHSTEEMQCYNFKGQLFQGNFQIMCQDIVASALVPISRSMKRAGAPWEGCFWRLPGFSARRNHVWAYYQNLPAWCTSLHSCMHCVGQQGLQFCCKAMTLILIIHFRGQTFALKTKGKVGEPPHFGFKFSGYGFVLLSKVGCNLFTCSASRTCHCWGLMLVWMRRFNI